MNTTPSIEYISYNIYADAFITLINFPTRRNPDRLNN